MTETTLALGWLLAPRHHGRVEEGVPDLHIRRMHQARQDGVPQVQETWHPGVFLLLAGVLQRQLGTAQGPAQDVQERTAAASCEWQQEEGPVRLLPLGVVPVAQYCAVLCADRCVGACSVASKFDGFKFTGPLRPGKVSGQMSVPAHIARPDYAKSSTCRAPHAARLHACWPRG